MTKTCVRAAARSLLLVPHLASAVEFDPVTVTATGTAQTLNNKLALVNMVDLNNVDRLQAKSLQDHSCALPELEVTNKGRLGKPNSVFRQGRRLYDLTNMRQPGGYRLVEIVVESAFFRTWRKPSRIFNRFYQPYPTGVRFNQHRRSRFPGRRYQS